MASRSSAGKRKGAARPRASAASAAAIQAGLDRLPIGFALFDAKWRLAAWNGALASICGYPKSLLSVGTPVQDFLRFNAKRGDYGTGKPASLIRKRLAVLSGRKPTTREQKLADGRTLRISTRPVAPGHRLITFEDVTEARLAEERYEVASRAVNEGLYDWDIDSGRIYYSERVYSALGFSPKDYRTVAGWRKRIHPDDLPRFTAGVVAHLKGESDRFECDYRYRARDGTWRWARQHGIALRDASGRAIRMIGSTGDINDLKRAEAALKQSEERYTLAMRAATEGVYEWDLESNKLYISDTTKVFFWSKLESLTPQAWNERVHPDDFDAYREAIAAHFKGMKPQFEHEYRLRDASGGYIWVLDRGIAVRNAEGRATRLVGAVSDITPRRLAEEKLRRAHEETTAALERQTATAEILRVISDSPTDVQPVLDVVCAKAAQLCEARDAIILVREGDMFRFAAHYGTIPNLSVGGTRRLTRGTAAGRSMLEGRQIHVHDLQAEGGEFPEGSAYAREFGYHTSLLTPLMREGAAIGTIMIRRAEVRPFTDTQLALVSTFADQAVIAIENVRLFNETTQALERQTATAEILKVMAKSPSDVQPVFDAIASSATRVCNASFCIVFRFDGTQIHVAADDGRAPGTLDVVRSAYPSPPGNQSVSGRAILERRVISIADAQDTPDLPEHAARARAIGYRSILAVPMMKGDAAIGTINVARLEVNPFTQTEVTLLKTFADQAVIAIENVRLFNETTQALERQTATADILKVIASSPSDVQPAFEAIVGSAVRLVNARACAVSRIVGGRLHLAAHNTVDEKGDELLKRMFPFDVADNPVIAEAVATRDVAYISDTESDPRLPPEGKEVARGRGYRSMLHVPLVKDGAVIGLIHVTRVAPGAFTQHHIALLKTFADQAVIAIENVRLFNQTREALERQTATAEILKVISSSPTNVRPVFDAIAERAALLCAGRLAYVTAFDGEWIHLRATYGPDSAEAFARYPIRPGADAVSARVVRDRAPVQIEDVLDDADYAHKETAKVSGFRSGFGVPMMRDGQVLGAIVVARPEPGAIPEKLIQLLKTFADQAVIAIENVRLFNETKDALERQTATAEILRVISSTPTDTQPVFDAIVAMAFKLFSCWRSAVLLRQGDHFSSVAVCTRDGVRRSAVVVGDIKIDPADNFPSRVIVSKRLLHLSDWSRIELSAHERRVYDSGTKASLMVPLLREDNCIGVLAFLRADAIAFDDREIALAQSFANQAVIAIENVRLFNETKEALEQQTATAEVLKAISRTTFDLDTVLSTLLENATRLSGAERAVLLRPDGEGNYLPAVTFNYGADSPFLQRLRDHPLRPGRDSITGRALVERRVVHVADVLADPDYQRQDLAGEGRFRTVAAVPMLRDGEPTGLITFTRSEGSGFTERQLQLMTTFADQAAIAIENVRLFNETKEALEQQKASGEVLAAISSSIADTQPVFDKIIESCDRLFAGRIVGLNLIGDDGLIHLGAYHGEGREGLQRIFPLPLNSDSGSGLAIVEARVVHYPDAQHGAEVPAATRQGCTAVGIRSVIFSPVLWEGRGIGAIFVGRDFVSSFSEKEIALLRTFCEQAAIAIQNAKLFREIEAKSRQLEVASHHKSQFLASMSHELRTPLNAILGFNEMILDGIYGELPEDVKAPLENMQSSGKHLLRLINNVLDLAKIEAGRMELALSDYSVQDTVASVHSTLKPLAADKGLEFLASVPDDVPLAYGDGGRIAQCLMNLAGNSLKFTKAGKVEIAVEQKDVLLVYRVADTGIGIPPDKIGGLFTEFKQTDATIASEYGGTGLGLSISRKFIEMHGGRIWVESEPGKGSTFLFEIPLRVPQ